MKVIEMPAMETLSEQDLMAVNGGQSNFGPCNSCYEPDPCFSCEPDPCEGCGSGYDYGRFGRFFGGFGRNCCGW